MFYFCLDLRLILDPATRSDYSPHIGQCAYAPVRTYAHLVCTYGQCMIEDQSAIDHFAPIYSSSNVRSFSTNGKIDYCCTLRLRQRTPVYKIELLCLLYLLSYERTYMNTLRTRTSTHPYTLHVRDRIVKFYIHAYFFVKNNIEDSQLELRTFKGAISDPRRANI